MLFQKTTAIKKDIEIPLYDKFYIHRTCGYKNRNKIKRIITNSLKKGAIGSFFGFNIITSA